MQSLKKGAASYILKEFPKAYTTHCCSHSLNLSLASTCKIPIITNIVEIYKSVLIYFNTSPKRENLLIHMVEQKRFSEERKKVLIGLCQTRWSERDVSYERFYLALPFIVETFEVINGTHTELDEFEEIYIKGWDAKSKVEATQFLNSLTKFEFVIGMIALYRLLHPVAGITQKLQGRTIDVIDAYQNVNTCIEDIQLLRENVDQESDVIFKQAVRMADQLNVEPNIPRVAKKQIYRDNVPANSPEEYYKRALVIPIVDTFISEMTYRFNNFICKAAKLLILTPSVLCSEKFKENVDISPILEEYGEDLINRDVVYLL